MTQIERTKILQFYFIRHGQTEWNLARRLQGSGDSPLTETGKLAAKQLGQALAMIPFVAGFSSHQQRAVDSLSFIVGERSIPCQALPALAEMRFGQWEGQSIDVLRQQAEYQQLLTDPVAYQGKRNGGETYPALLSRSLKAMHQMIESVDQGAILVVAHGMILRLLIHVLSGKDWQTHRDPKQSQCLDNMSVTRIHYTKPAGIPIENGIYTVVDINNTNHNNN